MSEFSELGGYIQSFDLDEIDSNEFEKLITVILDKLMTGDAQYPSLLPKLIDLRTYPDFIDYFTLKLINKASESAIDSDLLDNFLLEFAYIIDDSSIRTGILSKLIQNHAECVKSNIITRSFIEESRLKKLNVAYRTCVKFGIECKILEKFIDGILNAQPIENDKFAGDWKQLEDRIQGLDQGFYSFLRTLIR